MNIALRSVIAAIAIALVAVIVTAPNDDGGAEAAVGSWSATYYNNMTLSGSAVLTRNEGPTLDFSWTGSPGAGVNAAQWSARYERTDTYTAGTYRFTVTADDGVRVYVDGALILDRWVDQSATTYTVDRALTAGSRTVRVELYNNCCDTRIKLDIAPTGGGGGGGGGSGWAAEYFNNKTLSGQPALTRTDAEINFDWGSGSPGAGVNADSFSARWTRQIDFGSGGVFQFTTVSDDGVRVYVDGTRIMNFWVDQPPTTHTVNRTMTVLRKWVRCADAVQLRSAH
jgi:hypothetical protein